MESVKIIFIMLCMYLSSCEGQIGRSNSFRSGGTCDMRNEDNNKIRATLNDATSFNSESDASKLKGAMDSFWSTDEQAIINVLGRRTAVQRLQIANKYREVNKRSLISDLKDDLSNNFEDTAVNLATDMPDYLAKQLKSAMEGPGTDENKIIEILCSNDNKAIREIKTRYRQIYKKTLESDLQRDSDGSFEALLNGLANANRNENGDLSQAPKIAKALDEAGQSTKYGVNEAEIVRILSRNSYSLLRCIFDEYYKITGTSFDSTIISKFSGDFRGSLLNLYSCIQDRSSFFAKSLYEATQGQTGTDDEELIRIIITRSEIDMVDIKNDYYKSYGTQLVDVIKDETSGDYERLLLELVN